VLPILLAGFEEFLAFSGRGIKRRRIDNSRRPTTPLSTRHAIFSCGIETTKEDYGSMMERKMISCGEEAAVSFLDKL